MLTGHTTTKILLENGKVNGVATEHKGRSYEFHSRRETILCAGTFGIGSARIQAPIALRAAGVRAVLAPAFAPIFFENCLNGGYLLPLRAPVTLPETGTEIRVRIEGGALDIEYDGYRATVSCSLPGWALAGRRSSVPPSRRSG